MNLYLAAAVQSYQIHNDSYKVIFEKAVVPIQA
jgi:hypothetical protein